MNKLKNNNNMLNCIIIAVLVVLDQISKWLARAYLQGVGEIPIINGLISFVYVENRGAAYGIFQGKTFALSIVSFVIMIMLVYAYANSDKFFEGKFTKIGLVLMFAGGMGNFIDRFFMDYVTDFINFMFISFPVFNLADIYTCVGAGILIISELFFGNKKISE